MITDSKLGKIMGKEKPSPIKELQDNVALPFTKARAMPKSVYTSDEFLNYEIENVFK